MILARRRWRGGAWAMVLILALTAPVAVGGGIVQAAHHLEQTGGPVAPQMAGPLRAGNDLVDGVADAELQNHPVRHVGGLIGHLETPGQHHQTDNQRRRHSADDGHNPKHETA